MFIYIYNYFFFQPVLLSLPVVTSGASSFQGWDMRQHAAIVDAAISSFQKDYYCCSVAPAVTIFSVVMSAQNLKSYF